MRIDDIEIKIKKYDREKQVVIANIIIADVFEVRGFRIRYGRTKYSPNASVWIASPPVIPYRKKYYWVCEFKDNELWQAVSEKLIRHAKEYTNINI